MLHRFVRPLSLRAEQSQRIARLGIGGIQPERALERGFGRDEFTQARLHRSQFQPGIRCIGLAKGARGELIARSIGFALIEPQTAEIKVSLKQLPIQSQRLLVSLQRTSGVARLVTRQTQIVPSLGIRSHQLCCPGKSLHRCTKLASFEQLLSFQQGSRTGRRAASQPEHGET